MCVCVCVCVCVCLRSNIGEDYLNFHLASSFWASALKKIKRSLVRFLETQIMFFKGLKRWDEGMFRIANKAQHRRAYSKYPVPHLLSPLSS